MHESLFVSRASFWTPRHLGRSCRWLGHVPFAFWLLDAARPRLVVQLGPGPANALLAFCQAIERIGIGSSTSCFAVSDGDGDGLDGDVDPRNVTESSSLLFSKYSFLVRATQDEALARFENGSVDLLHLTGPHTSDGARHAFEAWSPRMSDQGIILIDDTDRRECGGGLDRLFRDLSGRYATFEFPHDSGLLVVGVGKLLPPPVVGLLSSTRSTSGVENIQRSYARLGQGLIDDRVRQSLEVINDEPLPEGAAPASGELTLEQIESENALLTERTLQLSGNLQEVLGSRGWALVQKARKLRMHLTPEGTIRGRSWRASSRFVKTASSAGLRVALSKAATRIKQKISHLADVSDRGPRGRRRGWPAAGGPFAAFLELPWRHDQGTASRPGERGGHFKVLLVSHEATRTGAPLCVLRLAEQLARNPDFECWIILERGGELEDEFERVAPVVSLDLLANQGIAREEAPDLILALYREYADSCVAICNTACVGGFYSASAAHGVPVLAWLHEMPTAIDAFYGGRQTVAAICRSARRIVTPADAVGDALAAHYRIQRDRIRTIYNGLHFEINPSQRPNKRLRVRKELGLPVDSRIVLGCGTIELRKGVDLFTQLARRVLADHSTPDTWFLWVGKDSEPQLRTWLDHDIVTEGLRDRVRFLGPRDNSIPYFLAADVFLLTSREDPCPMVNMEAMASGLPIVAFRDAGGAPELLEGCGVVLPYVDLDAMTLALVHLLGHPKERESLGRRALAKIRSGFTWPGFADKIVQILEEDYDYLKVGRR
ncbi:MAG: glycosyltransferase [Isosphaerales bacterium]